MPALALVPLLLLLLPAQPLAKSSSDGEAELIEFQVTENAKIGARVGSLAPNMPASPAGKPDFSFTQNSRFFSLDRARGELKVKSVIDREALCHFHPTCCPQELDQRPPGAAGKEPGAGGAGAASGVSSCYIPVVVLLKIDSEPVRVFTVRVHVQDVNDEPPKFPAPQQRIELPEDAPVGTKKKLSAAHDPDDAVYATKKYWLEHCDSNLFNLTYSRTPGRRKGFDVFLILTKSLDREQQARYRCRVAASDGVHTESMDVEVSVEDVNDNGPRWSTSDFQVSIPEDTQRYKEILRLKATDKDEKYGLVRYRFANNFPAKGQNPFSINTDTGMVTVDRDLDYDVKGGRLYHLPVVAYDNGKPVPLSATATLTVTVTDVNDNPPVIKVDKNPQRILENTKKAHLNMITVSDKDHGRNGQVTCTLADAMSEFSLRRMAAGTYSLRLKKPLDREALPNPHKAYIKTEVECSDNGDPQNTANQRIILYVDDVNDNPPRFLKRVFNVYFAEGNEQGTEILVAKAEDRDRGQNAKLDYSLVEPEKHAFVAVHRHSGAVTAAETFDRERQDRYEFRVMVRDFGEPRLNDTARVILHITDRNDNAPKFVGSYTFRVPENATKGTLLGRLNATDPDKGENGTMRFERTYPYFDNVFQVTNQGEVRLVGHLDREKTEHYTTTVKVEDLGNPPQSSTTSLLFEIQDVNDSPPHFINFINSVNLSCADALQHNIVVKLDAVDADSLPENRKMEFKMGDRFPHLRGYTRTKFAQRQSATGAATRAKASDATRTGASRRSGEHEFEIDKKSGRITIKSVPKVCKPRSYHLYVTVYDPDRPSFSDSKMLNVLIVGTPRNYKNDYGVGRPYRPSGGDSVGQDGYEDGAPDGGIDNTILFVIILICVSIIILVLMVAVVLFLRRRPEDQEPEEGKEEPMRYPSQPSTCHLARKELEPMSAASGALSVDDIYKHGDAELQEKAGGKLDVGKSHYKTMPSNFKEHFNECDDDDEDKTHKALLDQQASYESQHTYQSMASQDRASNHEYTDFNQELFSYIPDSNLTKSKKKSPHFTISFV